MTVSEFYESSPRDIYNYIIGRSTQIQFDIEQGWDYVRYVMAGSMIPYSTKSIRPTDIIKLDRDKIKMPGLTPYEQQELERWSKRMDEEMNVI